LGSLQALIDKQGQIQEIIIAKIVKEVLKVLSELHLQGLGHFGIKLSNLLFDSAFNLKISDFHASLGYLREQKFLLADDATD